MLDALAEPIDSERAAILGQTAFPAGCRGFESRLLLAFRGRSSRGDSQAAENKRAVMTDRDGGFLVSHKAFNGHLPTFSGKHLPRVSLADKSVRKLA